MKIAFTPLAESHFPLLLKWLETPHVKKWWDQDVRYTIDLVKEKFGKHIHSKPLLKSSDHKTYAYIMCSGEEMIGYIQSYNARDFAQENNVDLSAISGSICGIDLFIGESPFLHKGWGAKILNEFGRQVLTSHFDWCLIDPATDNLSAIKAFTKAGFEVFEQFKTQSTTWMIKQLLPLYFTYDPNQIFDEKSSKALINTCKDLTSIEEDFKKHNIYTKQDDKIVAGAIAYIHGKILWLDSIYVEERLQNKGLGRELIIKLLELGKAHNFREIQLNTYFPKACQFFKKCGFEEVAVIPNWKYDLTCYLMRKAI